MKLFKYSRYIFQGNCLTRSWYSNWVKYAWQVVCCIRWRVRSRRFSTHTVTTWGCWNYSTFRRQYLDMIHVFSTGNYITVCGQPTLLSFARYLSHGPPIVYLLLKKQILFLQAKIILTALALWDKNGKAQKIVVVVVRTLPSSGTALLWMGLRWSSHGAMIYVLSNSFINSTYTEPSRIF